MKIKIILLLAVLYLGSLLLTLPAQQVVRFIPQSSGITIGFVSGTLWDGSASQINYKNQFQLQNVEWTFDWFALLALKLKLDIDFNNGAQVMSGKGAVRLGFSGWSVENFVMDISAPELIAYANIVVPAEITGDLSLVIKSASQGSPYCDDIDGFVVWNNAKVASEFGNVDLKSAHLDLSCDTGQLVGDLQQDSEQLTTSGKFILKENGLYQLQGLLKPGEQLASNIKDLFSWVGAKNKSGETVINLNGKL
jgi:general secretion pathway protein N